jgi:hypothetical protein
MAPRSKVNFDTVRTIALALPGVEESTSYGTRALKVNGKFMARLKEDGVTLVVKCGFDERDLRMQARPDVFFNTPHYHGYPAVLVRLGKVSQRDLRDVLLVAWRRAASRRLVAAYDAA